MATLCYFNSLAKLRNATLPRLTPSALSTLDFWECNFGGMIALAMFRKTSRLYNSKSAPDRSAQRSTRSPYLSSCVLVVSFIVGCVGLIGCNDSNPSKSLLALDAKQKGAIPLTKVSNSMKPNTVKPNTVLAQGRLQPEGGMVRISALPGDKVDQVLVRPGQAVQPNQPLFVMQSHALRALELETAELRLEEAIAIRQAKEQEADLAVEAANLKLEAAIQSRDQAVQQVGIAKKNADLLTSLKKQIDLLQSLREDSLTRAAVGTIELDSKKNELEKGNLGSEQSLLVAEQSLYMAELQITQGKKSVTASEKARALVDAATPIASLKKQIELLRLQLEQSNIVSPLQGAVISVNVEPGERTGPLPLAEVGDLSSMICIAEVHESDAARVSIDDRAELSSSALGRKITGRVQRIDRVVGAAQMRSPNPMARSDFRSIPVWIAIDKDDSEVAAQRLQLQVDVSITTTR